MSRILRRPMFRGGRVDSRGTGITANLGYNNDGRVGMFEGGIPTSMMEELTGGANKARSGSGILKAAQGRIYSSPIGPQAPGFFDKLRAVPYLGRAVPFLTGATGTFGSAALGGTAIGKTADFITRATDTPEAYQFRKDATRADPFLFDETSTDEFIEFSEKLSELDKGEKPGLYPGGYDKFLKDKGYEKKDGVIIKKKDEPPEEKTPSEVASMIDETLNKQSADDTGETKPEVSAKELVAENKELFEELLGKDKARRRDVGDMLGRASAAFLGAPSVREGFADYMKSEVAAGPGRSEKIGQTAAALAINDYVAGKRSKENLEKTLAGIDYRISKTIDANKLTGDWISDLRKVADRYRGQEGTTDVKVIQDTLFESYGKPTAVKAFPKKEIINVKSEDLAVGFNIVIGKDGRKIIEKTETGDIIDRSNVFPI